MPSYKDMTPDERWEHVHEQRRVLEAQRTELLAVVRERIKGTKSPVWFVVEFGRDGCQVAFAHGAGAIGDRYFYGKKWRKNSRRWTGVVKIAAGSIIREATADEIGRVGKL